MPPHNQSTSSYYSSGQSESPVDFYPFKYDQEMEVEEVDSYHLVPVPKIGSKIDELFDSYFEDSLFRLFFPQPLKYSPLFSKFSLVNNRKRSHFLPKGALSYSLFGPRHSSTTLLQWQKILYQESLLDFGILSAADLVVDPDRSHRYNRRMVYELAGNFNDLALIRAGKLRSTWRFMCHFTIYFVKGIFAGFGMYTMDKIIQSHLEFFKE